MPETFSLTLWSLLLVAGGGVFAISLARLTRLHPAYFFLIAGTLVSLQNPFPFSAQSLIGLLAEVGALYLVFLAALDIEWDQRFGIEWSSLAFALVAELASVAPIFLALVWLTGTGAVACISAALLIAVHAPDKRPNIAGDTFRSNVIAGQRTFAALFSEITALIVLALLPVFTRQTTAAYELLQLAVGALLLVLVLVSFVPQALRFLLRRVGEESYALYYLIIGLTIAVILAVRRAGIEPLLGAYAAGFVITRFVTQGSRILGRLRFTGMSLLVPAFYLYLGLSGILFHELNIATLVTAFLLTLTVVILRWLVAQFSRDRQVQSDWVRSLRRNPLVLVLLYFAAARGLMPASLTQALLWHFIMSELTCIFLIWRAPADPEDLAPVATPRVLLPLSNPETMLPLMNLATHLGEVNQAPKLFPLNVVPDDAGAEDRVRAVEARFNQVIPMYTAREQTVELTARIENDRIRAVTHAARELLCNRILLGLGAVPTLTKPQGYSFLENLALAATDKMVFAANLTTELSVTNSVNVIIPHVRLLESCTQWLPAVFVLAKRLRAEPVFFGESETLAEIKLHLQRTGEKSPFRLRAGHIHAGLDLLTLDTNPNALTLAVMARAPLYPDERIHARLPEMMLRAFADKNFLLVFPPEKGQPAGEKPRPAWKRIKRWFGF